MFKIPVSKTAITNSNCTQFRFAWFQRAHGSRPVLRALLQDQGLETRLRLRPRTITVLEDKAKDNDHWIMIVMIERQAQEDMQLF